MLFHLGILCIHSITVAERSVHGGDEIRVPCSSPTSSWSYFWNCQVVEDQPHADIKSVFDRKKIREH